MDDGSSGERPPAARSGAAQTALQVTAVALVYFITARLSLLFSFEPEGIAAVWLPTGIFLSALLLSRREARPWLALALFLTDLLAERLSGTPWLVSVLYTSALTGDALLSCWLLLRFVGEPISFGWLREVVGWLVLSVLFSNALTSLLAATASMLLPGTHSFWGSWRWWATSDGVGNLLVTPFALSWAAWAKTRLGRNWSRRRAVAGAALATTAILLLLVSFRLFSEHPLFTLFMSAIALPFLAFGALRAGVRGVATGLVVLAATVVPLAATGRVPSLSYAPGVLDDVLVVQMLLAIIGAPSLLLAAVVAEHRQAEAALRQSEERYRSLFDRAGEGIVLLALDGTLVAVNEAFARMHGYGVADMAKFTLRELDTPASLELVPARMARVRAGGVQTFEVEHYHRDGHAFPLEVSASLVSLGDTTYILCFHRDIAERKRAAEARRQDEERLRLATVGSNTGLWDWDLRTNEVHCSPIWKRQIGYEDHEIAGSFEEWRSRVHPDDLERAMLRVNACLKHGLLDYENEFRLRHKDGSYRWILAKASVLTDASGQPCRMIGSHIDITERKQAEEALQRQAEELRARNQELTRFNEATVDRELRMIELKREVNDLLCQAGQPPRYRVDFAPADAEEPRG